LLEAILGRRPLDAGTTALGHGVVPGYFSQQTQELPTKGSLLEATTAATGLTRPQAQTLLGRFLFSGWETHGRAVAALSGGERRRLALALLVASGANFLVLDEPTNHLDLESREALEVALEAFPGTVLIVSHDRALLDAVPDRLVAIEDGTLRSYEGGWADKAASASAQPSPEPKPPSEKAVKPRPPRARPEPVPPSELERVEGKIAAVELRIVELEGRLAGDWSDMDVLTAHRAARDELKELLLRWEVLFEEASAR
jgi:ATP-binding cassette subfamily F protein 3